MKYAYTTLSLAALTVAQQTYQVQVGPGLSYSPDSVTAAEGDIVQFTFGSGHDVVSGAFDSPCQPDGVVSSGMGTDGQVFSVTINSTDAMWIYCSVPQHCERGMAMVINPPSEGNTLDDYVTAASTASGSSAPEEVVGGTYDAVSGDDSDSDDSSSTDATPTATDSDASATDSASDATDSAASSAASVSESGASPTASGDSAGGEEDAAGSVVAPLSFVLAAVLGGAALVF